MASLWNTGLKLVLDVSIDIIINCATSTIPPLKLLRPVDYDIAATVKFFQNGSSSASLPLALVEPKVTTTITEVDTIEEIEIKHSGLNEKVPEPISQENKISSTLAPVVENSETLHRISTSNDLKSNTFTESISTPTVTTEVDNTEEIEIKHSRVNEKAPETLSQEREISSKLDSVAEISESLHKISILNDLKSNIFADSVSSPTANYTTPFKSICSFLSAFEILRPHLRTSDCVMGGEGNSEHPTDCLDEFLNQLHLHHLSDYLRVLGCTCTRDLLLLEKSELEAIQLVPRRRLQHHLNNIPHQHEAPPEDCSLNEFLQWFGLLHIESFLNTIGVFSVGDLSYLKEEDLCLLRPVTRRRLLTSCGHCTSKSGEIAG